jgi:hypothetical protein
VFFVAPNVNARFRSHRTAAPLRLTAEAEGLSVPTFGMRLMKGFFFPTWADEKNDIGWMLIPRVGVLLSGTVLEHDVWTVRTDAAFRVPLGPNSATQLNSFVAPLDILLAAPLTGVCARAGGAYDHAFGDTFRLRGEANLFITGGQGNLNVERRVGRSHRASLASSSSPRTSASTSPSSSRAASRWACCGRTTTRARRRR